MVAAAIRPIEQEPCRSERAGLPSVDIGTGWQLPMTSEIVGKSGVGTTYPNGNGIIDGRGWCGSGLSPNLTRRFVRPETEEPGVTQMDVARPLGEGDLGDEPWLHPGDRGHLLGGDAFAPSTLALSAWLSIAR